MKSYKNKEKLKKNNKTTQDKQKHSPTLNTIRMVEETIKKCDAGVLRIPELKKALPKKIHNYTLKDIISYLEESGKIIFTSKGIVWTEISKQQFEERLSRGKTYEEIRESVHGQSRTKTIRPIEFDGQNSSSGLKEC